MFALKTGKDAKLSFNKNFKQYFKIMKKPRCFYAYFLTHSGRQDLTSS